MSQNSSERSNSSRGRRVAPISSDDPGPWVANLRDHVQDLLDSFAQNREEQSESDAQIRQDSVRVIQDRVEEIREEIADFLNNVRDQHERAAVSSASERQEYVAAVSEWVQELRAEAERTAAEVHKQRVSSARIDARERRQYVSAIEDWAERFKREVGKFEAALTKARWASENSAARERQAFADALRDDVRSLVDHFRSRRLPGGSGTVRARAARATPASKSTRGSQPSFNVPTLRTAETKAPVAGVRASVPPPQSAVFPRSEDYQRQVTQPTLSPADQIGAKPRRARRRAG
jgi:hypothetical protein